MCGICACCSKENCVDIVLQGLKDLEYRGYDSAGIAYQKDSEILTIKAVGEIKNLMEKASNQKANIVIGHTRWATHGSVCEKNAHPQVSSSKEFALVHNGIIENYKELKSELKNKKWNSDTDSEVFVNLIEDEQGTFLEKVVAASKKVKGTFAVAIIEKNSKQIIVAKRESPLYVARIDNGIVTTSDVYVLGDKAKDFYTLNDDEFAVFDDKEICFYNKKCEKIHKKSKKMPKIEKKTAFLGKTHMQSEIFETKNILKETLKNYLDLSIFSQITLPKKLKEINLIACGTAYHSALLGVEYFKQIGIPAHAYIASEFRYGNEILDKNSLYIFVSQSGETADTIACAKLVKDANCKCLALTNTPNCYLNQICQSVLPTFAGKEIAVASTKAFSCQVFVLYLFSLFLSNSFENEKENIKQFVDKFSYVDVEDKLVEKIVSYKKIFFVGREFDYVTALEGSLKLKEISYINSFAIAAGELKHGTLALIDEDALVIAVCTQSRVKEKLLSNLEEIKARGGKIVLITSFNDILEKDVIKVPAVKESFLPIVSIIPLQMLALKVCESLGFNPDKPKNLAKSVTVE